MAGLYIHIPKCASRCAYCDFYSAVGVDNARLVAALKREITARRDFFCAPPAATGSDGGGGCGDFSGLDTIYFGGGTPSQLTPEQLQELLDHSLSTFNSRLSTIHEISLEANPEDLTEDYLARLAATDFNRLSIGIQSFDDSLLRLMNRRHTALRATEAVRQAQAKGFDNISIDLIWGIPTMTGEQLRRTLESAMELGVQHISAYHLTIEPATAFGRSKMRPIAEAESERQYETLRKSLSEAGFEQYEISNWALHGRRAVHNSAYWSGAPYLGIGPGAHSYDGRRRRSWVKPDIENYLAHFAREDGGGSDVDSCVLGFRSVESGEIYGSEVLSDADLRNERLMVGLRTTQGVDQLRITNYELRDKFLKQGLLAQNGENIFIPPEKFLLSDYIISSLFE